MGHKMHPNHHCTNNILSLGAVWIDNVSTESDQRKFKLFRHLPRGADLRSHQLSAASDQSVFIQPRPKVAFMIPLFLVGCALTMLLNRLR